MATCLSCPGSEKVCESVYMQNIVENMIWLNLKAIECSIDDHYSERCHCFSLSVSKQES